MAARANPDGDGEFGGPRGRGSVPGWLGFLLASLFGAVLAWWASSKVSLWPRAWQLELWPWLCCAIALHLPYTWLRALRIAVLLDPMARQRGASLPRRPVLASGALSFFWLLVLPLRLGELVRPLMIARFRVAGVSFTETLTATAIERIVDALTIVAMLAVGLWISAETSLDAPWIMGLRTMGAALFFAVVLAVVGLVAIRRRPECIMAMTRRVPAVGRLVTARIERVARATAVLETRKPWIQIVAITLAYWGVTVVQAQCMAWACGLQLGLVEMVVVVAVVGLAIQIPAGPAQAGSHHAGHAAALSLFVEVELAGLGVANYVAGMWLLGVLGAAVMALPAMIYFGRSGVREAWRGQTDADLDAEARASDSGAAAKAKD